MVVVLLSMQGQKILDFIQNMRICVAKMDDGLTGLERHESDQLMTIFIFGCTIPLTSKSKGIFTY